MDLTPRTLRDVEFREKLRGYHPDDVDEFLEDAANAVDALLARVADAEEAARSRPVPVAVGLGTAGTAGTATAAGVPSGAPDFPEAGGVPTGASAGGAVGAGVARRDAQGDPVASDATLRRTLLLAQRTADLTIAEAQEHARAIIERARAEAGRSGLSARADVAAETELARTEVSASIAELEQRRARLEGEVSALQSWVAHQRDRLRDALSDQVRTLDTWLAASGPPVAGSAPGTPRQIAPGGGAPAVASNTRGRGFGVVASSGPLVTTRPVGGPAGRGRWGGPAALAPPRAAPDPPAPPPAARRLPAAALRAPASNGEQRGGLIPERPVSERLVTERSAPERGAGDAVTGADGVDPGQREATGTSSRLFRRL